MNKTSSRSRNHTEFSVAAKRILDTQKFGLEDAKPRKPGHPKYQEILAQLSGNHPMR
jgi:hypothetical protein